MALIVWCLNILLRKIWITANVNSHYEGNFFWGLLPSKYTCCCVGIGTWDTLFCRAVYWSVCAMSIFTFSYIQSLFRIMDCFLCDGIEIIFRVALTLLTLGKHELLLLDIEGVIKVGFNVAANNILVVWMHWMIHPAF